MQTLPQISDICFLPLDIPPIPNKQGLMECFLEAPSENYVWWNMEVILGERNFDEPLGSYSGSWTQRAQNKYPELIRHISNYLPFSKLCYIHLARAVTEVPPHVDENYVDKPFPHHMSITPEFKQHLTQNEPVGYRFIISGLRNTLYLCNNFDPNYKQNIDQKKIFCEIPPNTDFFVIKNSKVPHGVTKVHQDENRLIGFVLGFLDEEKHKSLIEKSYLKFAHSAILNCHLESLNASQVTSTY